MTFDDVEALARLAGIVIDPGHVPGVARNLETLADQAALLTATPTDPEIEPAPVFRA